MTAGWSLAQAIGHIVQHRCGVLLHAEQDTSVALLANFENDPRLPPNAASDAEDELVAALASGKLSATAWDESTSDIVELPSKVWRYPAISPALDGDIVVSGPYRYSKVRLLADAVRDIWPLRTLGQTPELRMVVNNAVSELTQAQAYVPGNSTSAKLTPAEIDVLKAVEVLTSRGELPNTPRERDEAIQARLKATGRKVVHPRTIQRALKHRMEVSSRPTATESD